MSGIKKLTSCFKKLTKDEREVEDLLATQLSRNSRTASIESARTLSTLSTAVMSIIDLTDSIYDDLVRPALTAIADSYYESDPDDVVVPADLNQDEGEVVFIATVVNLD